MATGYRIIEPSGRPYLIMSEGHCDAVSRVNAVQEKWKDYCDRNWLNDTGDVYTPELKIKRFLDSLAYILLLGNTDGIETNYRRVMHAKREIPASNCPSEIDNLLYGSGGSCGPYEEEELSAFRDMLDRLDERATSYESKKVVRKKTPSLFHKKIKKGITGGTWYRVDTEGKFWIGNNQYIIDDQEVQYQPVPTDYGDYYSMDKVLAANGKFYDMNYDEINVRRIGGILPYESFVVGTET